MYVWAGAMSKVRVVAFGDNLTPRQAVITALESKYMEGAEIAVVVFLGEDDSINTCWSSGSLLKRLGLLDFAKRRMIDLSIEDDDMETGFTSDE